MLHERIRAAVVRAAARIFIADEQERAFINDVVAEVASLTDGYSDAAIAEAIGELVFEGDAMARVGALLRKGDMQHASTELMIAVFDRWACAAVAEVVRRYEKAKAEAEDDRLISDYGRSKHACTA